MNKDDLTGIVDKTSFNENFVNNDLALLNTVRKFVKLENISTFIQTFSY
jgi:hypothetical protein